MKIRVSFFCIALLQSWAQARATPHLKESQQVATMFRLGPSRQGRSLHRFPQEQPRVIWKHHASRPFFSSPVVDARGGVYAASLDGWIYHLSVKGALRWKKSLGDRIYSSPAITAQGIVIGADNHQLVLLDPDQGKKRWSFLLGSCVTGIGLGPDSVRCDVDGSVLVSPEHKLYFGGDALYALTSSGRLIWRYDWGNGHAFSSPAMDPAQNLYLGLQGGALLSVDKNGHKRWVFKTLADVDSTPMVIPPDRVVVGCDDGYLYGLQTQDGQLRWKIATRGPIRSSPALGRDGSILVGSRDHRLYAVSGAGTVIWRYTTQGPIVASPVVDAAGVIVFGSQDDHLYALRPSGTLLWRIKLGGDIDSSVALAADGTIFVGADDGVLYALR